jgi:hypothetical protein
MSQAQLSGSPKSVQVKKGGRTETLQYGPLTYAQRGELDLIYAPSARSPAERMREYLGNLTPLELQLKGGPEWAEASQQKADAGSVGYEPNVEDGFAELLFLRNVGRAPGDGRDYRAAFLRVALAQRHPTLTEEQCAEYAGLLTKGQFQDIWNYCLELGPYRPKSETDQMFE